jgi:hypothetical protein
MGLFRRWIDVQLETLSETKQDFTMLNYGIVGIRSVLLTLWVLLASCGDIRTCSDIEYESFVVKINVADGSSPNKITLTYKKSGSEEKTRECIPSETETCQTIGVTAGSGTFTVTVSAEGYQSVESVVDVKMGKCQPETESINVSLVRE